MKNYVYKEGHTYYAVYNTPGSDFFGPSEKAFPTKKEAESFLASLNVPAQAKEFTVSGKTYLVWSDFIARCVFAQETVTGHREVIYGGGYIKAEKTIRQAIANVFGLSTTKGEAPATETKKTKRVLTPEQKAAKAARAKARREAKKAQA